MSNSLSQSGVVPQLHFWIPLFQKKHRWAAPFVRKFLLCFKSGNSLAESANSSVLAFLTGEQNNAELVSFLLQYIYTTIKKTLNNVLV